MIFLKKTSKKVISVIISIIMLMAYLPAMAFAETSGYYTYELNEDGNATITEVDTSISGDITVPSTLDGHPVTSIEDYAFWFCSSMTSITIPESITSIVDGTFACCRSLTGIYVDENNSAYSSQDGVLFNKSKTEIALFPEASPETNYIIPDSVTVIRDEAFGNCDFLKSITIPDGVTSIGYSAFSGCTSLTSVTIPDSVTSIGKHAFENCRAMTSATIGNGVKEIEEYAFESCRTLTSVTIGNSVKEIKNMAFAVCFGISDVYYNGTEEQWNSIAFGNYNTDLTSATIHCWTDWVVTTPATCTTKGTETRTCSACDDTETREIPAIGHGETEIRNAKTATCTEDGYTGDTYCSVCGEMLETGTVISAAGHNYGEWTVTTPATCTTEGQKQKVCSNCGDVITETIEKIKHVDIDGDGNCDVCGQTMPSESGKVSIDDFACKMCSQYETLKDIPFIGQLAMVIHFFIHLASYISYLT